MSQKEDPQFKLMTTESIPRLIPRLAFPTLLSMLTTGIYNTADTYFVSQLGTSASAAVGVVFSLMALIQAVGFTLGQGCGSIISRRLGEKNIEAASVYASSAMAASIVFGIALSVVSILHLQGLVKILGATPTIIPYAMDYAKWILVGAPIIGSCFVMNNILRSEGHAAFSAVALTSGGILNVLLDPIFIYGLKLGTSGAALATLASQTVSFLIFIQFFIRKKGTVQLSVKRISAKVKTYADIISTGIPALFRQGLASIATILLNTNAGLYGDAAISAMTIATKIIMLSGSVMIGIGQGFAPVAGYNYGAGLYKRVREAFKFTLGVAFLLLLIIGANLFVFAKQIVSFFRDDADVIKIGAFALRAQAISIPLHAFIISVNMLMQSCGKRLQATFLSLNRQGVYFVPLIILLPRLIGLTGVEIAQAAADILSAVTAVPYLFLFFRELKREEKILPFNSPR
ncbi:MAG: MATE family efflux transporter [Treponema sp.]|nr:MATE family efflux transporter [Treponema sp.]